MNNKAANYYTPPGSYDGAVKISGRWIRVRELNRINKMFWVRWQGPPSPAILRALKSPTSELSTDIFPTIAYLPFRKDKK